MDKKYKFWVIQIGEPLPIKSGVRKQRLSLLCEKIAIRGHNIVRYASAFDHITKKFITIKDEEFNIRPNYQLKIFKGVGYKKNISISRIIDQILVTKNILQQAKSLIVHKETPHLILVATPPHSVAYKVVKFAKKYNIPVVVDIRDQWPEIFLDLIPNPLKKIFRLLLYFEFSKIKYAFSNSTAITSVMKDFLLWGLTYSKRKATSFDRVFYIGTQVAKFPHLKCKKLQRIYSECNDKIVFIFIGTFSNYFNPSIIVDVARKLWNEGYKESVFLLAGDGDYYHSVSEKAKNLPNVKLLGWLKHQEIMYLLKFSDVGICPLNHNRPFLPNKVFIYLSAFLPIISSTQGEFRDIIEKYNIGFYYSPNNIRGLYNCIKNFINNPELIQEMKSNVKKVFWDLFYAEKIYNDFVDHLEFIIENYRNYV